MADSANGSQVEEAAIGRFRSAVESSNHTNAGYIWLMSSREHDDLIGLQFSTDPGVRNVRPEHFERLLDLDDSTSLRYVALVDDVPEAVRSLSEFLKDHKISDQVFLAHPALAATALETCGVRVRARRSFFTAPRENPQGRSDSIRSSLARSGRRGRTTHELGTLMDDVERSLLAAETLLASNPELTPPSTEAVSASLPDFDAPLIVETLDHDSLREEQSDTAESLSLHESVVGTVNENKEAAVEEPFLPTHRNPFREALSGHEIMEMEHAIVAREARHRLAYLKSLLVRHVVSFTVAGFLLGVLGVLALNLPSDTYVLKVWCLAGTITGLVLGLYIYWHRHGREMQRWRQTYNAVRGSRSEPNSRSLKHSSESLRAA